MSNDYFNNDSPIGRNTKARSADVRTKFNAIAAGFNKLPKKTNLEQGKATYAAAGGSADAYTAAMPATLTAYAVAQHFRILIPAGETNTGAATLDVDGLGARAIKRVDGTDVEAGDLTAGDIVDLVYNGTSMVMAGTYRSHMAGIAANLGANLVFSGNPSFTGSPDFASAKNKAAIRSALGLGAAATKDVQSSGTDVTVSEKLVRVDGARAAASRNYGGYYSAGSGVNIDTVSAGFVGLVSDFNAGTWPLAPFGGFVWVDTQAIYSGEAVLQRAVYGYGGTVPGEPVSFERVRANSGGGWSAWVRQTPVRGSNANGEYVKLPEGTLICTHSLALTGGGNVTITGTWVFPHPFIANPKISVVSEAAPPAGTRERTYWTGGSPTGVNVNASMNTNWPASTSEIHAVTAIGRWK